jgi:hypothetical protein
MARNGATLVKQAMILKTVVSNLVFDEPRKLSFPNTRNRCDSMSGVISVRSSRGSDNCHRSVEQLAKAPDPGRDCLVASPLIDQRIFVGQASLNHAVSEFVLHYHDERPHQGLDNELVQSSSSGKGIVDMSERLGGLLKYYHRQAA